MKEVYVLTSGEYSDHHVVGVFTTYELVDTYGRRYAKKRGDKLFSVDEYQINTESAPMRVFLAKVSNDGESSSAFVELCLDKPDQYFEDGYYFARGETLETALKNAFDYRAKAKAEAVGL